MDQQYLMGLDASDGGGRCLLINVTTGQITTAFHAWSHRPAPATGGRGFDLDVAQVWQTFGDTTHEALARANIKPAQVLGLAATSMRHGLVLLTADRQECFAVPHRDARATLEALELTLEQGTQLYQRTGHWPAPLLMAARLRWLARHAPERLQSARTALSISDWLGFRLTGMAAAARSQAGETLLLDLTTRAWADDLIAALHLPRALLPPLLEAGARLGTLTASAAAHLGLPAGIPVAVGGADTQSGLLGAGDCAPEQLAAITGATASVQLVTDRPRIDAERRLWTGLHLIPGRWVLESNAGGMGRALDWFARLLYPDAPIPSAQLAAEAAGAPPGAYGLYSTVGATVFNARQMALPVDTLVFSHELVAGLNERPLVARAILEGLAYALKANITQLLEVAGLPLTLLSLSGGLARSAVWAQLVSDVLAAPVEVAATPETTALGAALCAGVAAGRYANLEESARALVRPGHRYTPDPAAARLYRQGYADWINLRAQRAEADLTLASRLKDMGTLYTAATPAPATPITPTAPTPLKTGDVRDELLAILNELYAHGLITATGGNLSARVAGTASELWITPSQSFKGDLRPDMMVRIDLDGRPLKLDALPPSSEWRVHTAIYRRRPDVKAVVHTHAPQTLLLGLAGKPFLPISTEAAFIGDLTRVPFMLPGTQELADAVAEALGDGVAVLMQHHGLVVAGSSLRRAANVTEIIEETAEKILTCFMLGQAPPTLPDDVLAQLHEIGTMMV